MEDVGTASSSGNDIGIGFVVLVEFDALQGEARTFAGNRFTDIALDAILISVIVDCFRLYRAAIQVRKEVFPVVEDKSRHALLTSV